MTDRPLEYHRATSGTTRSYPSPLGILPIHQFRRKPNKYGETPSGGTRRKIQGYPKKNFYLASGAAMKGPEGAPDPPNFSLSSVMYVRFV
ncbi:hypothetical protein Hanom_Chr06g00577561 [Helianthus anomalus]